MAKKILTNLDLTGNQLLNVVAHVLATAPENPKEGQVYYDSSLKKFRYYDGTKWVSTDPQDVVLSADEIVNLINSSGIQLNKDKVAGLTEMVDSVKMAGDDIVTEINKTTTTGTINQDKITGLSDLIKEKEASANTEAKNQADNAVAQAKAYTDSEIARRIGGAGEAYDTFKEIEDYLKLHDEELAKYSEVTKKYTTTIGDGLATEFTIQHALNARDCIVQVQTTNAPYEVVGVDIEKTDVNTILVRTAIPVGVDALTVVVIG